MKSNQISYPKVQSVLAKPGKVLQVTFSNGEEKHYDCSPLLQDPIFSALKEDALFRLVQVDAGGYGVSWNDDIDLSEAELWLKGQ